MQLYAAISKRIRKEAMIGLLLGATQLAVPAAAPMPVNAEAAPVTSALSNDNSWPLDYVHGLVNLELLDHHLTPRGIDLQNKGVVFQSLVRLDWDLYRPQPAEDQMIDEISLTTAVWNDFDSRKSGADPGRWNEIDAIFGPNVTFLKAWTLEAPIICFRSETGSFATCWAWNPRLTYHDQMTTNFSINPYVEFFDELRNKITVVFNPATSQSSYYGVAGITPTYCFTKVPLKLELPTYILIPGGSFYQRADGLGGGTDLAMIATTLRATVPLAFVSSDRAKWSLFAAVQYDHLYNTGLLDGNQVTGTDSSREPNVMVLHGGVNFRF